MRSLQFTEQQLREHEARIARYRAAGRVRTVLCQDTERSLAARRPRNPQPKQAIIKHSERQILRACLHLLLISPEVAFAWRQNTGAARLENRFVRFSFMGCSDIIGMLADGRFLAVECKATGERATADQQAFLDRVNEHGGLGICVDDPARLARALAAKRMPEHLEPLEEA